jgi:ParB family chromosome partitioning protein
MAVKRGLGKGLDALIPDVSDKKKQVNKVTEKKTEETNGGSSETLVDINKVEPNRNQPRQYFDKEKLKELSDSIKQHGLITPILVQDRDTYYEIVAGERRWRASKEAGLKKVPVIIRNFTEQEILEISLIENIQREDLNAIEEARTYKRLMTEFNLKQDEVADRVNKSRATIANSVRLLKLCDNVQQMIIDGELSEGHARAIIPVENPDEQYRIALKIYNEKMSVRDIEKYIKNMNEPKKPVKEKEINESLLAIYDKAAEDLKVSLGTKVSISSKDNKGAGKIEIDFYNNDDFERIVAILGKGTK